MFYASLARIDPCDLEPEEGEEVGANSAKPLPLKVAGLTLAWQNETTGD